MIVHNGHQFRTLNDKIMHNGKQIVKVMRGGKKYYPRQGGKISDNGIRGREMLFIPADGSGVVRYNGSNQGGVFQGGAVWADVIQSGNYDRVRVRLRDGTNLTLTLPRSTASHHIIWGDEYYPIVAGVSGGLIAVCINWGVTHYYPFIFSLATGQLVSTLPARSESGMSSYPLCVACIPLSGTTMGVFEHYSTQDINFQRARNRYAVLTAGASPYLCPNISDQYWTMPPASTEVHTLAGFIGFYGGYGYLTLRLRNPADPTQNLGYSILARFAATENPVVVTEGNRRWQVLEELDRWPDAENRGYYQSVGYSSRTLAEGNGIDPSGAGVRYRTVNGQTVYEVVHFPEQTVLYQDLLGTVTQDWCFGQNDSNIWFNGVYAR